MKFFTKKRDRLQKLQEWLIEQQLLLQDHCQIPASIQLALYFLGLLQSLTFLLVPSFHYFNRSLSIDYESFLGLIYLVRFDLAASYFQIQNSNLFFIPLFIILLCDLLPLLVAFLVEIYSYQKQAKLIKLFFAVHSTYSQLYSTYLYIPLNVLCIQALTHDLADYGVIILAALVLAYLQLSFVLKQVLQLEAIDLKVQILQQLSSNVIDFTRSLFLMLQLLIFAFISQNETLIIVQAISVINISIIQILSIFSLTCCHLAKIRIKLLVSSFGILYGFLKIIELQYDSFQKNSFFILVAITPLAQEVFWRLYAEFDDSVLQSLRSLKDIQRIKYCFAKLFNNQYLSQAQNIVALSRVVSTFKCKYSCDPNHTYCLCASEDFFSPQVQQKVNSRLVKTLKTLIQERSKANQANYTIHYTTILFRLGYLQLAFQQTVYLISQKKRVIRVSSSKNEIQLSLSAKTMQFSNPDKSLSKDSKSQELNELRQRQMVKKGQMVIQVLSSLSLIQRVKINILKDRIKSRMQSQFMFNNNSQSSLNIKLSVQMFLESEQSNQGMRQHIINFLNKKLQFYLNMQGQRTVRSTDLFSESKRLCKKLQEIERQLNLMYEKFPSRKIQSMLSYFEAEIVNNIVEAYRVKTTSSLSEDKLLNVHKNIQTNLFSRSLIYMNLVLQDTTQDLVIVNASDKAHILFECSSEKIKTSRSIDFLIPDAIRNEHQLLVSRFLQTGQSKFYLNSSRNFCRIGENMVKPIQFFFDIQLNVRNEVQFFAFFEEMIQHSAFILLDVNGAIGGITKNFFEKLESPFVNLENISIEQIFPSFRFFPDQKGQPFNTPMRFLRPLLIDQDQKTSLGQWQSDENILHFETLISLEYQDIYGYCYLIIQVKEIKWLRVEELSQCFAEQQASISNSSEEGSANDPYVIVKPKFFLETQEEFAYLKKGLPQQLGKPQIQIQFQDDPFDPPNILSPNQSMNGLMTSKLGQSRQPLQQDFFNQSSQLKDLSSSSYREKIEKHLDIDESGIQRMIQGQIDQQMFDYDRAQLRKKESEASSFTGIKKAQFYKKYEIVYRMLQPTLNLNLRLFLAFFILMLSITQIYAIITLTEANNDLQQFTTEIDMIALRASFMAPHDICLGTRITVVSYEMYMNTGKITRAKFLELAEPLYQNQDFGFNELKSNFYREVQNPSLQPFFKDRNITVVVMNRDATSVNRMDINIREALFMMIHYYYQFKLRFERRLSPANQTYQVFQFANILNFHYWMEDLAQEILQFSKDRSQMASNKWTLIWVAFLIVSFILITVTLYYFLVYLAKYDKYLNLFKYCQQQSKLNRDIERYKYMLKLIQGNTDAMFHYTFDLEMKEKYLMQEKPRFQLEWKSSKETKSSQQNLEPISKTVRLLLVFFIWILYMVYSTISNQQTTVYMKKYYQTTNLYKLVQDMTFSSGSLYQLRNFRLLWRNFTYLTPLDEQRIYESIYFGLNNIDLYHESYIAFDPDLYLITEDFTNYYWAVQKQDICKMIGENDLQFLIQYCNSSLSGTLQQGLQTTLNYIKHQIQNQMAVNNFTERVDFQFYESEGGLIVIKAFQQMTRILKSDILAKTRQSQEISNSLSGAFIGLAIGIILILLFILKQYFFEEFATVNRFIQLIPTPVLFFDEQFERNVRILLLSQDQ